MSHKNRKYRTGDVIGKLTVVEPYAELTKRSGYKHWCRCKCGKLVLVNTSNLKRSHGCGCEMHQRISGIATGDRFGKWTVIQAYCVQKSGGRWCHRCQCECGVEVDVEGTNLKQGRTLQCKDCESKSRTLPNLASAKNKFYSAYRRRAKMRGYEFALTKEQVLSLAVKPCFYCGARETVARKTSHKDPAKQGVFRSNGIDRVDNNQGYTPENCVPCCVTCNRMKLCQSQEGFILQVKRIYERHCT